MLRKEADPLKTQKEWTKYFVNGIECERNAIYQTILDNKFYNGTVNIDKKYHLETTPHDMLGFRILKNSNSLDLKANMSLDTKDFVEKFNPTSEEYKLLIERMTHVVDMLYETERDYSGYSDNFRIAVCNCITFKIESLKDTKAPYNDIFYANAIEMSVFLFNMVAFVISGVRTKENINSTVQFPRLEFDMSSIKENWDDNWTNSKKSQFLKKYLHCMLEQADVICKGWMKHELFADKSSKNSIKTNYDGFKKFLKSLQDKKATHDATLLNVNDHSLISNLASFFHLSNHHSDKDSSATSTPSVSTRPMNGK